MEILKPIDIGWYKDVHDVERNPYITYREKSLLVYNSSKTNRHNGKKFVYLTCFVHQLQKLYQDGYDTIYFVNDRKDSLILSMIEQALHLANRMNHEVRLICYDFGIIPDFILRNCYKRYCYNDMKGIYSLILAWTSKVIGLVRENDAVIKRAIKLEQGIYKIYDSNAATPIGVTLTSNITLGLTRLEPLDKRTISKIDNILACCAEYERGIRFRFDNSSKLKFSMEIIYDYNISKILNDDFIFFDDCFISLYSLISGDWYFYLGYNKLILDEKGIWRVWKLLTQTEPMFNLY